MLKRFFIVFMPVLVLVACDGPKKPKNLISKKKMVNILIDAKLIASAKNVNRKTMEEKGIYPDTYIFNKYNIDSTQFAESNAYYTYRIKDYEEIYLMVKDSLAKLKATLKEQQEKEIGEREKKSRDSLNAVIKLRDSLKLPNDQEDSLDLNKIKTHLKIEELESIDDELELIEPVSDK